MEQRSIVEKSISSPSPQAVIMMGNGGRKRTSETGIAARPRIPRSSFPERIAPD
jgi:hypothetical protein